MGSWIVVVSGALMSMHVLGINLAPLLTVGGISGIVVGLSAQALLGNMISGLNLVRCYCITAKSFPIGLLQSLMHECMHCSAMKSHRMQRTAFMFLRSTCRGPLWWGRRLM